MSRWSRLTDQVVVGQNWWCLVSSGFVKYLWWFQSLHHSCQHYYEQTNIDGWKQLMIFIRNNILIQTWGTRDRMFRTCWGELSMNIRLSYLKFCVFRIVFGGCHSSFIANRHHQWKVGESSPGFLILRCLFAGRDCNCKIVPLILMCYQEISIYVCFLLVHPLPRILALRPESGSYRQWKVGDSNW